MKPFLACQISFVLAGVSQATTERAEYWVDLHTAEQVSAETVIGHLAKADVIYVGEIHSDKRHHQVQTDLLKELCRQKQPLVLAMEQLEARHQVEVDRFNHRELDFDGLAKAIDWPKRWKNYEQYRELCQVAQDHGVPLRALNAPAEIIRSVGKGGLASLSEDDRRQLADEIIVDDPEYQAVVNRMLGAHSAMTPEKLQAFFEAQVARDETMAANIHAALTDSASAKRTVFVVCGRGHINYGLGTASRMLRRVPAARQKIVHITESASAKTSSKFNASESDRSKHPISTARGAVQLSRLTTPSIINQRRIADFLCFKPRHLGSNSVSKE